MCSDVYTPNYSEDPISLYATRQFLQMLNLVRELERNCGFIYSFPIHEFLIDQEFLDKHLMEAIEGNNYDLVDMLLKYGANPNYWPKKHVYPDQLGIGMSYPVWLSLQHEYLDIVELLRKSGAKVAGIYYSHLLRTSIVQSKVEMVKYLCENGVAVEATNHITALYMCDADVLDGTCIADRVHSCQIFMYLAQIKSDYLTHMYFDIGDVFIGNLFIYDE